MERGAEEKTVALRYFSKDVVPFAAMVSVECVMVGANTLFKAATLRGLSFYVYIFYSYVVATIVLLPLSLIFGRFLIFSPYIYLFQQYDLHLCAGQEDYLQPNFLSSSRYSFLRFSGN